MARREVSIFNLSFLDVMSCGLGAIVLFFILINAQIGARIERANQSLLAETRQLENQVLDGRKGLVRIRNSLQTRQREQVATEGEARRLQEMLKVLEQELAQLENQAAASDSVEKLQADVRRLQAARRRLAAQLEQAPASGQKVRSYIGDGNRQYLTGMKMGGKRVLILVDASASMLGRTIVNAIRFRHFSDAQKLRTPKWRQAVRTVDWLTTQIEPGTRFQIYTFNTQAGSVLQGTDGRWLEVTNGSELDRALAALQEVVPGDGTSLYRAFEAASRLQPAPDNIYLLTDGLPTQGKTPPGRAGKVKPSRRADYFSRAVKALPKRVPVNVLLFPMDGDPAAAGLFWQLAVSTRGSFLTPARDWP